MEYATNLCIKSFDRSKHRGSLRYQACSFEQPTAARTSNLTEGQQAGPGWRLKPVGLRSTKKKDRCNHFSTASAFGLSSAGCGFESASCCDPGPEQRRRGSRPSSKELDEQKYLAYHHLRNSSVFIMAYIAAAKRTAFGAFGGKLSGFTAAQLGGHAAKAALAELPEGLQVDSTIFGVVCHSDNTGPYTARHVGHHAGLPVTTPALTINRLCGSGFQSIINAVHEIKAGDSNVVLTGGTENMSMSPYTLHGVRFGGSKFGVDLKLVDSLMAALTDMVPKPTPMGEQPEIPRARSGR